MFCFLSNVIFLFLHLFLPTPTSCFKLKKKWKNAISLFYFLFKIIGMEIIVNRNHTLSTYYYCIILKNLNFTKSRSFHKKLVSKETRRFLLIFIIITLLFNWKFIDIDESGRFLFINNINIYVNINVIYWNEIINNVIHSLYSLIDVL